MGELLRTSNGVLDEYQQQVTIRHLYYRLVGAGALEKTEKAYSSLCSHLAKWRRAGKIPWCRFSDGTRFYRGSRLFSGMAEALENTVTTYRRNLWQEQPHYLEVWVEKDAISGIVSSVADKYGIRTFVCRGFPSLTSLYNAAQTYRDAIESGKEVAILYLGDHDPSGKAIDEAVQRTLRNDFALDVPFKRLAVLPEQIHQFNLPTRPPKASDNRAANWEGGCVEIDTLTPAQITDLIENAITERIDPFQWSMAQEIEAQERKTLETVVRRIGEVRQ